MSFVITGGCIDVTDRSCVEECPVDCIYEGDRKLYINPDECIDCGACEPVCPVDSIFSDRNIPAEQSAFLADSRKFFEFPLQGRESPLGNPGGSLEVGRLGVDTPRVAAWPIGSAIGSAENA